MADKSLTVARLKEVVSYDPETGIFTRIEATNGRFGRVGMVVGGPAKFGYRDMCIDGNRYMAHRAAWLYVHGNWPKFEIDHINGIKNDNRISNLRDVEKSHNQQNRRKAMATSKTGVLGVSKRGNRFVTVIGLGGGSQSRYIGMYKTAEEAQAAYFSAKKEIHPGSML